MSGSLLTSHSGAPRRTRGAQDAHRDISLCTSLPKSSTADRRAADQTSGSFNSASRTTQRYPQNPLSKNSRLPITRTGIPAPAKLTIPETIAKAELSRSSTHAKTPDSGTSRLTLKDKFIKGVLSTQLGQAVSDNLAPHIPRTAVAGFPEDDQFHSRNSYINATMTLWDHMRANEVANKSFADVGPKIEPDEVPTFTRPDADILHLPLYKQDKHQKTIMPEVIRSQPSPLRSDLKINPRIGYPPPVPPKDQIDHRIPLHQPLKAQTYHGRPEPRVAATVIPGERVDSLIVPKTLDGYQVAVQPSQKAKTYHGKEADKESASVLRSSLPESPSKQPNQVWKTNSLGEVKYWESSDPCLAGLLLKAAPNVDVTEKYINKKVLSEPSIRGHRHQQVFGSFSKSEAEIFKRSSDMYRSNAIPEKAQTYPHGSLGQAPDPSINQEIDQDTAVPTTVMPRSVVKRKPVARTTPMVTPLSHSTAKASQIPRLQQPTQVASPKYESSPDQLLGLQPLPENMPRVRLTAEQRQQIHRDLKGSNPDPDSTAEPDIVRAPAEKHRGRKPTIAQAPLNPRAKTYIHQDRLVEQSQVIVENNLAPVPGFVDDFYRPSHNKYLDYPPGLNPTAKTYHQKGYF